VRRAYAAAIGLATVGLATLVALTGATRDRRGADGVPRDGAAVRAPSSRPTPRAASGSAREASRALHAHERALLRTVFGIDDVGRLYASDTTAGAVLLYGAMPTGCVEGRANPRRSTRLCRPVPVRVGLTSPRRPDETWDAFVARVARRGPRAWPGGVHSYYTSLASLDPDARPRFERLVATLGGRASGCGSPRRTGAPSGRRCSSRVEMDVPPPRRRSTRTGAPRT
jgi:hypothetical protein